MMRFLLSICMLLPIGAVAVADEKILVTKQTSESFIVFEDWQGPPLRVWFHIPDNYQASTTIVFVMHGVGRDADRYYDEWQALAEQHSFVLLVPEFSKEDFPGAAGYNLGNMYQESGELNDESFWSFSAIDSIFVRIKDQLGSQRSGYRIYGHSAGAQFVHRFILFKPTAKYELAITANAGWYTIPGFDVDFPYGLRKTPVNSEALVHALQQPVMIMLGALDNDPNHPSLRKTQQAQAQGLHRFERGHFFFKKAKDKAASLAAPFNWSLHIVPNAEHQNRQMAQAAAAILAAD